MTRYPLSVILLRMTNIFKTHPCGHLRSMNNTIMVNKKEACRACRNERAAVGMVAYRARRRAQRDAAIAACTHGEGCTACAYTLR